MGRHENKEPRRDATGRVVTRRSEAVQRIVAGQANSDRVQSQEANALRRADDKFGATRNVRRDS